MIAKGTFLETGVGTPIKDAAIQAINIAKQKNESITLVYNSVEIVVSPRSTQNGVVNTFFAKAASMKNMAMPALKTYGA